MAPPTLRQFGTLLAAVEAGSISAAARALNLTQPAVSQQLRELERALGVRLLERAGGRVVPTAAGAALLPPAQRARAALQDAVAATAQYRAGTAGRVRLGTGATACIHLLPPVLATVKRRMPGLRIVIATGSSTEMLLRLESGDLDLALVTRPAALSRAIAARRLRRDALLALLPDGMDMAATPAALAALPLILYERSGTTGTIVDAWFRNGGQAPRAIMELGNVEAIKVLVGSGLGSSVLPRLALSAPVPGTRVQKLRPALSRELVVAMRREKVIDRGLRVFLDALETARGEDAAG